LRADADDWLELIAANSDVGRTLRENCAAGGKAAYVVHGARACATPLWLDGAPTPVAGPGPIGLAGFLRWVSDWALAFGAAGGVLAGLILRKVLIALGARSSIQWLVDL
jgi:hypothetical protein